MINRTTALLLRGGVIAGPLFVATALAEGATRRGYVQRRHPVSSLALGSRGWVQTVNFLLTGTLYVGAAIGLWRSDRVRVRIVPPWSPPPGWVWSAQERSAPTRSAGQTAMRGLATAWCSTGGVRCSKGRAWQRESLPRS